MRYCLAGNNRTDIARGSAKIQGAPGGVRSNSVLEPAAKLDRFGTAVVVLVWLDGLTVLVLPVETGASGKTAELARNGPSDVNSVTASSTAAAASGLEVGRTE